MEFFFIFANKVFMMKKLAFFFVLLINLFPFAQNGDWKYVSPYISGNPVEKLVHNGSMVYTLANQRLYVSNDGGFFWDLISFVNVRNFTLKNNKGYRLEGAKFIITDAEFKNVIFTHTFTSPTDDYSSIYVFDDNNILLTGANKVAKSSNGGQSWTQYPVNSSDGYAMNITQAYFLDANLGFCIAAGAFLKYIYKTVDGGVSWSLMHSSSSIHPFKQIVFKDALNGIAVDDIGYYYYTQDGGSTWTFKQLDYNTAVKEIALFNGIYYAVGNVSNIMQSTDGINWNPISTVSIDNYNQFKFVGISIDQNQVIISTSCQPGIPTGGNAALIKTTDFQNFTELETHFRFADNKSEIVEDIHGFVGGLSSAGGHYYYTHNEGVTWDNKVLKGAYDIKPSGAGVFFGGASKLYVTNDFGLNYITKNPPVGSITSACVLPNNFLLIAYYESPSQEGSVRRFNISTNVSNPEVIVPEGIIKKVLFKDDLNGFILNNGGVYRTLDGGLTWAKMTNYPASTVNLNDITYDNVSKFYIGRYYTNDMGNTWLDIAPGSNLPFENYEVFSDGKGFMVYDNDIFNTINYGATWNLLVNTNALIGQDFNKVGFSRKFLLGLLPQGKLMVYRIDQQNLGTENLNSSQQDDVKIYPNPVDDEIHFSSLKVDANVEIYDYTGKLLFQQFNVNKKINVYNLPKGNYILLIKTTDKILVRKFIKK